MAEIRSLRDRFRGKVKDIDGIADDALSRGTSAVDFKDAVLERMAEQKPVAPQAVDPAKIGMSEKDLRNYSLFRAIRAFVDKSSDAGLEFEASRAMAEQIGRDPRGFFVPQDVLADPRYGRAFAQRAGSPLNVTTAAEGGDLVATNLLAGSFIEMLYNATVVSAAGATILDGLVGNVDIPRQTAGADFAWVAENIAPAEDASTAFDQVALTPKTVGGWVAMTRRLLKQSTPAVEGLVRRDLVRGAGVAIDKGALIESGAANNPKGVINQTGVASVVMGNPDGALPTWAKMVEFETGPAAANAEGSAMAYIVNAKTRGVLKVTKKDDGSGMFVWDTGNAAATPINGYRAFVTNILRSNLSKGGSSGILSEAVFGNWSDLLIGMWGGLDIFPDPYTQADKGNLILRVFQDCDVAVRHGVSFAASSDIKTS